MGGLKDFLTEKEVFDYMHDTGRKCIIFEGSVYDVTDYIGVHPGGTDKIEPLVGQNIDQAYTEAGHTRSARNVFRDLEKVGVISGANTSTKDSEGTANVKGLDGTLIESKINLDYNKGLFW